MPEQGRYPLTAINTPRINDASTRQLGVKYLRSSSPNLVGILALNLGHDTLQRRFNVALLEPGKIIVRRCNVLYKSATYQKLY